VAEHRTDDTADETVDSGAEPTLDPAESLRIIADQTSKVRAREPDERLLFAVWGTAWLVGYLALYLTAEGTLPGGRDLDDGGTMPASWAFAVFGSLIIAAVVTTVVHTVRGTVGIQGVTPRTGAMYGWSWFLGFAGMGLILGGLERAGASDTVMALASNALACLVVGVLYMAGGAFWQDTRQYAIGVWILLVAAGALYAGLPGTYLVMGCLGGGGFFAGALGAHLARRRR